MAGSDVIFGPWPGGINRLDYVERLRDDQLESCLNLDIDNTGVLRPRRPLRRINIDATLVKYLVGTIVMDGETQPRAVVNSYDGTNSTFNAIENPQTVTVGNICAIAGQFHSVVQYQNKIWYIPAVSSSVGHSSPSTFAAAITSVAAMPYGDYGFILKDRLFIVRKATSEIYFSKATDFTVWAAPDGGVIQINPGDNQPITKVVVVNNQVVIFKRDSTFVLSFTANPTGDGAVRQVSADQGALDAITYNNEVYCYNARSVFKFVNGFFQDIGLALNLPNRDTIDSTSSNRARINIVGKTLILGTTPSNLNYAMNLDTGAWTMYQFSSDISISTGTIYSRSSLGTAIFFGSGSKNLGFMLVSRDDSVQTDSNSSGIYRLPTYSFRTKDYSFDDANTWKRFYSCHLDAIFQGAKTGTISAFINRGTSKEFDTTDVDGLIGSRISFRFKEMGLQYEVLARTVDAPEETGGPIVRGIRSVIGIKAPVSK